MKQLILNVSFILFYPLTYVVKGILLTRHFLYDTGILKSKKFSKVSVIAIGNLSLGGTGKTPMVQYLAEEIKKTHSIAILSRGYGRKSKGFKWVKTESHFLESGDEPLLIKNNFPEIPVAVCENRKKGINKIIRLVSGVEFILLDDALQHRKIRPTVSILLTTWYKPFTKDHLVPAGTLRDLRSRARLADAIVVTKIPDHITTQDKEALEKTIEKYSKAPVFYARSINHIVCPSSNKVSEENHPQNGILITTLANPSYLKKYLEQNGINIVLHKAFRDHKPISATIWKDILQKCISDQVVCYTTEKEWVKVPEIWKSLYPHIFRIVCVKFEIENKEDLINVILSKSVYEKNYTNTSDGHPPADGDRIG